MGAMLRADTLSVTADNVQHRVPVHARSCVDGSACAWSMPHPPPPAPRRVSGVHRVGSRAMRIHPDVAEALADGRPVVALESTIIAHGLPRPENLTVARELEAVVRSRGAVPATIAVLRGEVRIGLDAGALERLATGEEIVKCAIRDL